MSVHAIIDRYAYYLNNIIKFLYSDTVNVIHKGVVLGSATFIKSLTNGKGKSYSFNQLYDTTNNTMYSNQFVGMYAEVALEGKTDNGADEDIELPEIPDGGTMNKTKFHQLEVSS